MGDLKLWGAAMLNDNVGPSLTDIVRSFDHRYGDCLMAFAYAEPAAAEPSVGAIIIREGHLPLPALGNLKSAADGWAKAERMNAILYQMRKPAPPGRIPKGRQPITASPVILRLSDAQAKAMALIRECGDPYRDLGIRSNTGGAYRRMIEKLQAANLIAPNGARWELTLDGGPMLAHHEDGRKGLRDEG